jgi:hypothetical protein
LVYFLKLKNDGRLYKNRMLAGVELPVFEKPESILHSTRCPLDTLEKPEGRSLQKWKSFCVFEILLNTRKQ